MYRVLLAERITTYVPSEEPGSTKASKRHEWEETAAIQGEAVVVAGALRAMADKLDPPKTTTSY